MNEKLAQTVKTKLPESIHDTVTHRCEDMKSWNTSQPYIQKDLPTIIRQLFPW